MKLRVLAVRLSRLIACSLLVAGCQKKTDGKVHITYWEMWTGVEAEAMQTAVDAFNRKQDRIVVEYLSVSDIDRKTLIATAGGDPPDVAGLYTYNIYPFADDAALTPLDDYIKRDGQTVEGFLSRYYPVFGNLGKYRGKLWALPTAPTTVALHWNKGLFREAGLDPDRPPQTLEELDRFSEKLTRRDPKTGEILQLGFLPQEPNWWIWAYPAWFGSSPWDGNSITLKTPQSEACYDWVASYSRKYGLDAIRAFSGGFGGFSSPQSAFFAGKVAMVFQGVWLNNFIRQYSPGLEYGVAGWPATPGGASDFTIADANVIAIPRGAKHAAEAWEFIKYISSSNPKAQSKDELSGMEILCYLQEKNSPLLEWSPFFQDHHPHPHIDLFRQLGSSPHAFSHPKMGIWQEYQRELANVFDQVRLLEQSPQEALDYAQGRMTASWSWYTAGVSRRAATEAPTGEKTASP